MYTSQGEIFHKMEEDYLPSESEEESDGEFDLYGEDPIFKTKEDLDSFMKSCDIKMVYLPLKGNYCGTMELVFS